MDIDPDGMDAEPQAPPDRRAMDEKFIHKEFFEIFKQLGPRRTLRMMIDAGVARGLARPTPKMAKNWSKKYRWISKVRDYDISLARKADKIIQEKQAETIAEEITNLSTSMREVSAKILGVLNNKVGALEVKTGAEAKSAAEAAIALNKAAEVLDGGVSDRTERVSTASERVADAQKIVNDAFSNFRAGGGNDNGRGKSADSAEPVAHAGNARTGTTGI